MAHFEERPMSNIPVKASSEYKLRVRLELSGPNWANTQAYAPKYPKEKTAGWIILLGDKASGKVLACQKVPPINGGKDVRFFFRAPEMPGLYTLTLFVMSDAYLGIDQEYSFQCHVTN
ncbi:Type III restriction enzymeres subunit family protein [Aphelenchoides avenae]|nr:Type III restriction enzymeres subunit family protein [Aphelenchus avenae]